MLVSVYYLRKIFLTFSLMQLPIEAKPTSYDLQRMIREKMFDERIATLKDELSAYRGTTAEILHPDIVNLPHDSIKTKYNLPSYEEVAE